LQALLKDAGLAGTLSINLEAHRLAIQPFRWGMEALSRLTHAEKARLAMRRAT